MFGVALYSTIFKLAVLDYFTGLKLAFVVTKFPQKVVVVVVLFTKSYARLLL